MIDTKKYQGMTIDELISVIIAHNKLDDNDQTRMDILRVFQQRVFERIVRVAPEQQEEQLFTDLKSTGNEKRMQEVFARFLQENPELVPFIMEEIQAVFTEYMIEDFDQMIEYILQSEVFRLLLPEEKQLLKEAVEHEFDVQTVTTLTENLPSDMQKKLQDQIKKNGPDKSMSDTFMKLIDTYNLSEVVQNSLRELYIGFLTHPEYLLQYLPKSE